MFFRSPGFSAMRPSLTSALRKKLTKLPDILEFTSYDIKMEEALLLGECLAPRQLSLPGGRTHSLLAP
ncbi:MAG: hypothetical protein Q4G68_14720 [Planctomycetia bacterium]|nr:hypothetical protein [Planctomycetia bacterium]